MSSTQLKAVTWGWRSYTTTNIPAHKTTTQAPVWLSIAVAFGIVVLAGFILQALYAVIATNTTTIYHFVAALI